MLATGTKAPYFEGIIVDAIGKVNTKAHTAQIL